MSVLLKIGQNVLRTVAGKNTAIERNLRVVNNRVRWARERRFRTRGLDVFAGSASTRLGIYAGGGCDMFSVVESGTMIRNVYDGTCAVYKEGIASDARSDLMLQSFTGVDPVAAAEIVDRLKLPEEHFAPKLFRPTFSIPGHPYLGEFSKDVVVLSIAADLTRTAYRHREHGFLVDPGGWWLAQSMDQVLTRAPDMTKWFAKTFQKVGRISLEDSQANLRKIIQLVREETGTKHVLVYNTLVVEPGNETYHYDLNPNPHSKRRREFIAGLSELSRELDFSIVDVDRILKTEGIAVQADFVHFTREQKLPVAREVFRILQDREVI